MNNVNRHSSVFTFTLRFSIMPITMQIMCLLLKIYNSYKIMEEATTLCTPVLPRDCWYPRNADILKTTGETTTTGPNRTHMEPTWHNNLRTAGTRILPVSICARSWTCVTALCILILLKESLSAMMCWHTYNCWLTSTQFIFRDSKTS